MLLVYNYVLLKMSTWCSKHVEESNILRINNSQCIKLVINVYSTVMSHTATIDNDRLLSTVMGNYWILSIIIEEMDAGCESVTHSKLQYKTYYSFRTGDRTLQLSSWHSCCIFGRFWVHISRHMPSITPVPLSWYHQSVKANVGWPPTVSSHSSCVSTGHQDSYREWRYHMLLVYNYVLLKMSTWCAKHVEESNILRINNSQCIKLVINV